MFQTLKSAIFSYTCILIIHYMLKHYLMNNQQYILDDIYDDDNVEPLETEEDEEKNNNKVNTGKNDLPVGACSLENDLNSFMKDMEVGGDIPDPFNNGPDNNLASVNDKENQYFESKQENVKEIVDNAKEQSKTWQNENNIMNGGELFDGVTGFDDFDTYSSFESI